MNPLDVDRLEQHLREAGAALPYPPTPQIAARVLQRLNAGAPPHSASRRWAWAVVAVVVVLSALMLVPPARAAILDFIQIGVVRILRGPNLPPAPVYAPTSMPTAGLQSPVTPITATPGSPAVLDLDGETTLADAQTKVAFPVLLPSYPSDLGKPDRVYVQDMGGPMLLLVWLDPARPDRVRMSMHEIAPGSWAITKFNPRVVQEVQVNGEPGAWTEGPYMLETRSHNYVERQLVEGHVLIWTENNITYRLETDLPVEQAIKIAESLKPVQ
ncbi:MAG: hypothetical protein ACXVCT_17950 [Ktedonobacterales bacterium]